MYLWNIEWLSTCYTTFWRDEQVNIHKSQRFTWGFQGYLICLHINILWHTLYDYMYICVWIDLYIYYYFFLFLLLMILFYFYFCIINCYYFYYYHYFCFIIVVIFVFSLINMFLLSTLLLLFWRTMSIVII